MSWPQLHPNAPTGSQFGPRIFKGNETEHIGRDQPVGSGAVRHAPAAGRVVGHGQTTWYGHWIAVVYDGSTMVERQHQVQAGSRLPVGTRFGKGDPLAKVGHPYLWLIEPLRQRMPAWSGGSKASSTGPHSHQQNERDRVGGTPIDPAGPEAAREWAKVIAHQSPKPAPAGTIGTPIAPILEEDTTMLAIHDVQTGHRFTVAPEFIAYESRTDEADLVAKLESATDEVHKLTTQQLKASLQSRGIPTAYSDPKKIPEHPNGRRWWSRQLAIANDIAALRAATGAKS